MKGDRTDLENLKERAGAIGEMAQAISDRSDLEDFRMKRAADYFNEKAKKFPAEAARNLKLSRLFSEVAMLMTELNANDRDLSAREERLMEECGEAFNGLAAEMKDIDAHVSAGIDVFIAEDPARWQRMKKSMPALVAALKPTQG